MTSALESSPKPVSRVAVSVPGRGAASPPLPGRAPFLDDLHGSLLTAAGFLLVALVALLDLRTESRLSFGLFYLIPVALCAWWGGFSPGVLVSLAGAVAWQAVDYLENPLAPPAMAGWNGVVRFGTLVLVSSLVSRLRIGIVRERLLARTDPLTGAANGRTFYETAAVEAERARRSGQPLTLAYLDLDNFKQLNDRLGHAAGDAALQAMVELIHIHLRPADLLARLGGDEFALLLPETGPEGAAPSLERLQGLLAQELAQRGWPLAVSIGAATFPRPPKDVDHMIQRVDALMYAAKRKGKGRIEHAVVEVADGGGRLCWERRAMARVLCNRPARIRREGAEGAQQGFATVRDIAATAVGLHLGEQLLEGTLLIVESLTPGPRTLLARVTHTSPEEGGWRHECELSPNLSAEELRCWLGEYAEVLCP
jgi:diguanylate cyclase (GGDEF)-like protein